MLTSDLRHIDADFVSLLGYSYRILNLSVWWVSLNFGFQKCGCMIERLKLLSE